MNLKKYSGIFVVLIALFLSTIGQSQETPIDTEAVIVADVFQDNADLFDGKGKLVIRVASAPTYTLSGHPEMYYTDKVTVDISKPQNFDTKIVNSLKSRELINGRNLTKISWYDGRRIYP